MQVISKYLNYENLNELMNATSNYATSMMQSLRSSPTLTTVSLFGALTLIATTHYYLKFRRQCRYFASLNIPGPKPKPVVGHFIKLISMGLSNFDEDLLATYGKIVGYYEGTQPAVLCSDLEMVKQVMISHSQYFVNRRVIEGLHIDPLDKFMNNIRDDEWKNVRAIASTTFTSGKLKEQFYTMEPCVDILVAHLGTFAEKGETFNVKEAIQKMTFDVMTSCCFGVQTDSVNNPDTLISKHLKKLLEGQLTVKVLLAMLFPNLMLRLFKTGIIQHFPNDTIQFFVDLVELTVKRRRNKEQYRNDFIQIMVDHEERLGQTSKQRDNDEEVDPNVQWKYLKKSLTTREILANAILFLFAGSETSATTLTYTLYMLAKYPDIQKKLHDEIDRVYQEHNNEVNYEMLNQIEYLDMVLNETLRIFPAALRTDRECNADYEFKGMKIPKGTIWSVSIWNLHHDPDLWPEPGKFIPERFSTENKKNRDNCAFIPFGAGPRNCLGMRFALMEMKMFLVKAILKYEFLVCDQTPGKIQTDNSGLAKSKEPIILKIVERS